MIRPTFSSFGRAAEDDDNSGKPPIPERIEGTYTDDFDILEAHKKVLYKIEYDRSEIPLLIRRRDLEEQKMKRRPQTYIERAESLDRIKQLDDRIHTLQNVDIRGNYIVESRELLTEYVKLGKSTKIIIFGEKEPINRYDEKTDQRLKIIARYLEVASRYIEVNVSRESIPRHDCEACGSFSIDESSGCCNNCGLLKNRISNSSCGSGKNSSGSRGNYEDRSNFEKAMKRFQGKQTNNIPKELYERLEKYFGDYSLPLAEEIRARSLNSHGRREGTSIEMLCKALYDIGRSAYYEDVNLIGHVYWGWQLQDLSDIEEQIMRDYDESQRVFEKHKGERKSCLNTQYRLMRHLLRLGRDVTKSDFKIVVTRDIIEYHENMWELICSELGWPFHSII